MADGNKLPNGRFLRIEELFGFVCVDETGEGVLAICGPGGEWSPLVGADMARVESYREVAQSVADMTGQEISIRRFSTMTEIGKIIPRRAL